MDTVERKELPKMGRGSTELEEIEHISVLISQGGKHKTDYIRKKFS